MGWYKWLNFVKVIGSLWYLLSVERQEECWKSVCDHLEPNCQYFFFDCRTKNDAERRSWFASSNITKLCGPGSQFYNFGIYEDALSYGVGRSSFPDKYSYCFWWGLRNLRYLPTIFFKLKLVYFESWLLQSNLINQDLGQTHTKCKICRSYIHYEGDVAV